MAAPNDLLQEITAGPIAASLAAAYAGGDDVTVAGLLNAPNIPAVGAVDRSQFAIWAGATGIRAVIQDESNSPASPLRPSALSLLDFLQGSVSPSLDLSDSMNKGMLDAWTALGRITVAQEDQLLALATHHISRATQLGWGSISVEDVARTRSL